MFCFVLEFSIIFCYFLRLDEISLETLSLPPSPAKKKKVQRCAPISLTLLFLRSLFKKEIEGGKGGRNEFIPGGGVLFFLPPREKE